MTVDQCRIAQLERKVKRLRANLAAGLLAGVVLFPMLLTDSGLISDPILALQCGVLLAMFLIGCSDWFYAVRDLKRDAVARKQAFSDSNSELKRNP